ncbi:TetR family transcriptional regulator [Arenicella chitinivorans]|uniref:TetR family transcriptional regulator n=1 Tax=Arenicella chitinivorans TaxID=1329800 RepID=A0A918S3P7_9GAMM|nr:TetR/AcrR family transcriptional regulator [Arenicella chitinivorans]GHA19232.1 TetR family transcriptional regulator [Arenicella chitinivorans]
MARKTHDSPEAAKEAILDAAESMLVDVGAAGLRISAVAKRAGMAHPNIIHHFGSRDGMVNALAERVGNRATERITHAIDDALSAPPEDRVAAITHILETVYPDDEGRAAVWLHLDGAKSSLKPNMERIVELSHKFRLMMDPDAKIEHSKRVVMLVTLALVGEVVSGTAMKEALGYDLDESKGDRAYFKRWLAKILLNLSDEKLNTRSNNHRNSHE